ncbi:MAG: aminotransferase class IV [Gemmatimonadota bacterium]
MPRPDVVHLNGEYLLRSEARISPDDRGFLFGDGLYEVSPAYRGSFLALERHMARLGRGGGAKGVVLPDGLEELHLEVLRRNDLLEEPMCIVYLQVTRGTAPRTHAFPDPAVTPTVYAWAKRFVRPPAEEWARGYGAVTVPDQRWARADVKTTQLLPQVLAQQAAREAGETDALMIRDGLAVEGAHNNVFFVLDDVLVTHPASNQILPGITREIVLELAHEAGIPSVERPVPVREARRASEIFFTGTTTEVRPTVRLDGAPVGGGEVGPLARRIRDLFLERIEREWSPPTRTPRVR